ELSEAGAGIDVTAYREEFPVLARKSYLISASLGPVSNRARTYLDGYLDAWAANGAPDLVWFADIFPQMGRLKGTFAGLIGADTALVVVNRVLYRTSAALDAKEVCRMAREAGAWSVVDDFHGAGIVPVDVHDLGCDFYTAGVLKWLCGGPGLTFLYARHDL